MKDSGRKVWQMTAAETKTLMKKFIDTLSDSVLKTVEKVIREEVEGPVSSDLICAILLAAAAKARGWDKIPAKGV